MQDWLHAISVKILAMSREFGLLKTTVVTTIGSLLASRKWLTEKYDGKILNMLNEARRTAQVAQQPGQHILYLPFPFRDIVNDATRSEKSVRASLRRLQKRGYVHEVRDGWNL